MPSANFSNKNIIAQWYVPAVGGTGLTDVGEYLRSRWEKLFWVMNRKLELPCPQDTAFHVSALIPLARGL